MKLNFLVPVIMAIAMVLIINEDAVAQKKDGPPPWAPAHGYRAKTKYVFFPQHNVYYDTQRSVYIYLNNGNWEIGARIPKGLRASTLRDSRQVELSLNNNSPQRFNSDHLKKYRDRAAPEVAKNKPRGR